MIDRNREAFKEEAYDLLRGLESDLLDLENCPDSADLIGSIFRAMHTIKGSGAMFGFDRIAGFTHNVETVYDLVRNGRIPITRELIDLTLSACDQIKKMIDEPQMDAGAELVTSFRSMLEKTAPGRPEPELPADTPADDNLPAKTYRIQFRPSRSICANGTSPLLLLSELHEMGPCTSIADTGPIPELDDIEAESCYTTWEIVLRTNRGINAIRDVFIFVEDSCELQIEEIEEGVPRKTGPLLPVGRGTTDEEELPRGLQIQAEEQPEFREGEKKRSREQATSIRVPADRLDALVDTVGELVTVQSRLSRVSNDSGQPQLVQVAEEFERLVGELRDIAMSIRMVPIGTTFSKFKRLVRDLSGELHKEVSLVTEGGETELDKTVIERLNDPLVHLIRNCVDHGIERPETREERGKPRQGTVTISAIHSGANVLIRIADDGGGLDASAIRMKALERGLMGAESDLAEKELYSLIFHPGFSTAKEVTNISGRGVGMDVVKKNVEALQGSLEVGSESGKGTTITLKIPLTLAIIDGLLVEIGKDQYVLPLSAIEECVELKRLHDRTGRSQNLASIRGEMVPYIILRELLEIEGAHPEIEQIVTAVIDNQRTGFVVDRVIGQHQTVIKSLGRIYRNVEEISGATILGDGRVALILDLLKLVKKAEGHSEERATAKRQVAS